jgi:trigger factor
MSIVSSKFASPIRYEVVFNLSKPEYDKWYERLLEQLLSRVEVPGYRPGKAPRNKLLANTDPEKIAQIIFQETADKYAPEMVSEANDKIMADNAENVILSHNIDQSSVKIDDSGFSFTLVSSILAVVDLSPLDNLKIKQPADKELELPSKKEFHTQEIGKFLYYFNAYSETEDPSQAGSKMIVNLKGTIDGVHKPDLGGPNQEVVLGFGRYLPDFEAGLSGLKKGDKTTFKVKFPKDYFVLDVREKTADFEAEVADIKQGKYLTIEELVEKNENPSFKSLVPDIKTLEADIEAAFETNKERVRTTKYRSQVIEKLLDVIQDFPLPEEEITKEFNRIKANVQKVAEENSITLAEVIKANGIPFEKEPKTDTAVDEIISNYVHKEFKLSLTLNYIYLRRISTVERATEAQVEEIAVAMISNPEQYNVPAGLTKEQATKEANDRIVRNISLEWVLAKVKE